MSANPFRDTIAIVFSLSTLLLTVCALVPMAAGAASAKWPHTQEENHRHRLFRYLDKNGDGGISIEEMREVQLRQMKQRYQERVRKDVLLARIDQRFQRMDENGDGVIHVDEFKPVQRPSGPMDKYSPQQRSALERGPSEPMPIESNMLVAKDISYRDAKQWDQSLNNLDVYYAKRQSAKATKPVIIFIHGGGWNKGDKAYLGKQKYRAIPEHFVSEGYIVVSPNFRYMLDKNAPETKISDLADDLALAMAWTSSNISKYGGSTAGFILWGYSSGAHLASLLATDPSYLRRSNLSLSDIKGVIAMDVPQYDVPRALAMQRTSDVGGWDESKRVKFLEQIFGTDEKEQLTYSPAHFLSRKNHPGSFLLFTAGRLQGKPQTLSRNMTELFKQQCRDRGVDAEHHHFGDYDHNDLLARFFDGEVSAVVERYLKGIGTAR